MLPQLRGSNGRQGAPTARSFHCRFRTDVRCLQKAGGRPRQLGDAEALKLATDLICDLTDPREKRGPKRTLAEAIIGGCDRDPDLRVRLCGVRGNGRRALA